MTQCQINADFLTNLSPVLFQQNISLLKDVAKSFKIDEKKLLEKMLPEYLDHISLFQKKKKLPCTYLFPELVIMNPKEDCCLARIVVDKKVSQCSHKKINGSSFCCHHQNSQPVGVINKPFRLSHHKCRMVMDMDVQTNEPDEEIICEEWIYYGNNYYWDSNTNRVYTEDGTFIGYRNGDNLEKEDS